MVLRLQAFNLHLPAITEDLRRRVIHAQRILGCQRVIQTHNQLPLIKHQHYYDTSKGTPAPHTFYIIDCLQRKKRNLLFKLLDLSNFLLYHQIGNK